MGKAAKRRTSKTTWDYKVVGGTQVKPVLYNGKSAGHGQYMAAISASGELVLDTNERPVPYSKV